MTVVVWYRNGKRSETLIPTPKTCPSLATTMFMDHKVGPSEIRALKPVEPGQLLGQRFSR